MMFICSFIQQAANNLAVCYLYLGQLPMAIRILDTLTTVGLSDQGLDMLTSHGSNESPHQTGTSSDPNSSTIDRHFCLHDTLVSNLAILYEVEADRVTYKRGQLLQRLASNFPGEPVQLSSFKLPLK